MYYKKSSIKNYVKLLSLLSIIFLTNTASAQDGCVATDFPDSSLNLTDGAISTQWSTIQTYANLTEYGDGGFMKFAHNDTDIFALFGSNNKRWIAIEFETPVGECMTNGHDTWIFYIDHSQNTVTAVDATMQGESVPKTDAQNDLHFEATFENDFTYIEVVRKLDTQDPTSTDITFANGTAISLIVASNNDHYSERSQYFLQVSFGGNVEPYVPPKTTDWAKLEGQLLYGGLVFAAIFILLHFILRIKLYPLAHKNTIVDSTVMHAPTFKERYAQLRGKPVVPHKGTEDADQ